MTTYHVTTTAQAVSGDSIIVPLNIHNTPVNVSYRYFKSGGGDVVGAIQHTLDPPLLVSAAAQEWQNHTNAAAAVVGVSSITFPIAGIRLNITSVSGSALVSFRVLQPGM